MELIAGDVRVPQKAPRFCAFHYCVGILSVCLCHIFSLGEGGKEGMEKKIAGGKKEGGWEEEHAAECRSVLAPLCSFVFISTLSLS